MVEPLYFYHGLQPPPYPKKKKERKNASVCVLPCVCVCVCVHASKERELLLKYVVVDGSLMQQLKRSSANLNKQFLFRKAT